MVKNTLVKVVFFNTPDMNHMGLVLLEGLNRLHAENMIELRTVCKVDHEYAVLEGLPVFGASACVLSADWADVILFDSHTCTTGFPVGVDEVFSDLDLRKSKCVMIDSTDSDTFFEAPVTFLAYFKKEIRYPHWDFVRTHNLRSLSHGYLARVSPLRKKTRTPKYFDEEYAKRDLDFSFIAKGTNGLRKQIGLFLSHFASKMKLNVAIEIDPGKRPIKHDKYREVLGRSKVAISCPGQGFDTQRYWEIPACGAVLCSFDLSYRLAIRDNFERDRHAIFFDSLHSVGCSLLNVITNKSVWTTMRSSTDNFLLKHDSMNRASDVIEMAMELKRFASTDKDQE
jgi:hypothetical protein